MGVVTKIVYLSEAQKNTLFTTGTVTSNGVTITYSPDDIYVTPDNSTVPMTGATSSTNGASGLVPAPTTTDVNKFLAGDGTYKAGGLPMVILKYGISTWEDFENAYKNNVIVYCRASSNNDPASGNQLRMAFMAYVNDETNPTSVEFQYYRSVNAHANNQMSDQVFVYKLDKTSGWTVTTREAGLKQIVCNATGISVSYNNNVITISDA